MTDPHSPVCSIHTRGECDCDGWEEIPFDLPHRYAGPPSRLEGRFETIVILACVFVLGLVGVAIATAVMG